MSTPNALKQSASSEISDFAGQLIGPEDAGYDEAREVYNAMIDRRPGADRGLPPTSTTSPRSSPSPRDHDVLLAVRGGGHNGAGLGTCDDGVVLDLSGLKDIEVDPGARTVRVGGGCVWGEVDAATNEHGMATPSGIISTTGVGGLTLGGGIGHLTRKCGLTIDNLIEAEVVSASGERVRASADENPDLHWAIRGGGGNFGVVTSFLFRLHEVGTVVGGPTFWPVEAGAEVLTAYRDFLPNAPRELNGFFAFASVPPAPPFPEELHLRKVCGVVWCYSGDPDDAAGAMAPLLDALPEPLLHGATADAATRRCRAPSTPSTRRGTSGTGAPTSSRRSPTRRSRHTPSSAPRCRPGNRPCTCTRSTAPPTTSAPSDTPWAYREANWGSVFAGVDPDPANADEIRQLVRRLLRSAAPLLGRRRLREHDDGRGPGAGPGELPRQLRPPGPDQGNLRPGQPLPRQPEHPAPGLDPARPIA